MSPPSQSTWWIESGDDLQAATRARVLPFVVVVAVLVVLFLAIGLSAGAQRAFVGVALLEAILFGGVIVVLIYTTNRRMTRAVGIAPHGVVVRRTAGDLQFGWNQLQPGLNVLPRNVFWFQTFTSGPQGSVGGLGGFSVSQSQARAIVLSPFAPPWVLSPQVANALGVPAQRVVTPLPSSPGHPPPPADPPASISTSSPNSQAGAVRQPTATPVYSSAPPPVTVAAPTRPTRPAKPGGPPIGFIPCPQCGQLNRAGATAFCVTCGHRLPRIP